MDGERQMSLEERIQDVEFQCPGVTLHENLGETTEEVIESTTTASQEMSVDNTTASEVTAADATSLPEHDFIRKNGKEERQDYYFLHAFDGSYSYSFKTSFHYFLPG